MDISGHTILSPGERSPGHESQYSGSQVSYDLLSWQECGSPVEIPQQSEENPVILEMRDREQQIRRQRDEALKHCGDMLRALQQVTQAVGEAGNVGPNRARHRASLTDNMERPYFSEIGPEFIGNRNENLPPTNDFSPRGVECQSLPQGDGSNWYRDNGDYDQFNRGPRLACPEYGEIRGDDRSEYLELPQYHSHEDLWRVRNGPLGPGVTCPSQIQAHLRDVGLHGIDRLVMLCLHLYVAPQYLPVAGGNKKSPISLREIKWNGLTLSHTSRWLRGGMIGPILKRDFSSQLAFGARPRKSSVASRSHKEVTMSDYAVFRQRK